MQLADSPAAQRLCGVGDVTKQRYKVATELY